MVIKFNFGDIFTINCMQKTKLQWKPGTLLYPLPVVLVTCGNIDGINNIITIAWTGIVNTNPAMVYISVRPERFSYNLIVESGEFAINLVTENMAAVTDWCGVKSGKDFNKFKETGLTPFKAETINCPLINESPVNIECKVDQIIKLGSHDMFLAKVTHIQANADLMDEKSGKFMLSKAGLIHYSHGNYYTQGNYVGKFGYSVEKKPKAK